MNKNKSTAFFSEEENARIRFAVENAEANTSGEIVTMVVDRSNSYREAEVLGAVLTAAFCAFLVEIAMQIGSYWFSFSGWSAGTGLDAERVLYGVSLWTYIPLVIILFFPLKYIFRKYERLKLSGADCR
jgi:putative membrane protein